MATDEVTKISISEYDIEERLKRIPDGKEGETTSEMVTRDTIRTLSRQRRGVWGDTAYLGNGAKLYADFLKTHEDYYPFSGEISHIDRNAEAIADNISDTKRAIIIGQGPREALENKELKILSHCPDLEEVVFVDVSEEYNEQAIEVMKAFNEAVGKDIRVDTHTMNFIHATSVLPAKEHTTVLTTGSLLSNIPNPPADGLPEVEISKFLLGCAALAGENGHVVIGYDSNHEDIDRIERSYKCDQVAAWVKNIPANIIAHTNAIEGLDVNPDNFDYEGSWNHNASAYEHKLKVIRPQEALIKAYGTEFPVNLRTGDTFVAIASVKPSAQRIALIGKDLQRIAPFWLETSNIYQSGEGIVEHAFNVKSSHEYERPGNGRGRLVQGIERRFGFKPN